MGYFLLYESMLDTVLDARDKYLVSAQRASIRGVLAVTDFPLPPPGPGRYPDA